MFFRYQTYYKEVTNPWSSSRPVSARGPDNANGSNSWSRPNKERVEAPWTFSPSEAMANDEPDYGANDDYGGGDDHITDDWEPPSRGPRTPPHRGGDESPLHKPSNTGKKFLQLVEERLK